ncbi:MAG: heavy metal translocating P-type ATPase [Myxococcales bacterium]|nr:heavy metal translocating P-type ATPase [Myxococcales bacterium]
MTNGTIESTFPVTGMTCASCASHVERALRSVPGVESVAIDIVRRTARVTHRQVQTKALVQAVESAGYGMVAPSTEDNPGSDNPGSDNPGSDNPGSDDDGSDDDGDGPTPDSAVPKDPGDRPGAPPAEPSARWGLAALLAVPVILLGMSHGAIPGATSLWGIVAQGALTTLLLVGPGRPILGAALRGAFARPVRLDMNTLVAVGVGAAWLYSLWNVTPWILRGGGHHPPALYFEAAAGIVLFVLVGRRLEGTARRRLEDAVRGLLAGENGVAHVVSDETGAESDVRVTALRVGSLIRVRPGERVPADAVIERGASSFVESALTGESIPVERGPTATILAGSENQLGVVEARVTALGAESRAGRIAAAVERAGAERAPIARLADQVSARFVPAVLVLAALTGVVWWLIDPTTTGLEVAVERFVAVLVVACPCALGLATPAAVAVATGRGAELGILVKGGAALEGLARVDLVLLDKTGTLTQGQPSVASVISLESGWSDSDVLRMAAAVERGSEHPLARAIVAAADSARGGASDLVVSDNQAVPGVGVSGLVRRATSLDDAPRRVLVASVASFTAAGGALPPSVLSEMDRLGCSVSVVTVDAKPVGAIGLLDAPAVDAGSAVRGLHDLGLVVMMATGDRPAPAAAIAARVGIDVVHAGLTPEDKLALVERARADGRTIAMVGDGLNDGPALAAADVGIAMGASADTVSSAADIVLLRGGIAQLPVAIGLARHAYRIIQGNLAGAFVYNVLAIPLAAGVFTPWTGWQLSPMIASVLMSLSSITVMLNALRLRRFGRGGTLTPTSGASAVPGDADAACPIP